MFVVESSVKDGNGKNLVIYTQDNADKVKSTEPNSKVHHDGKFSHFYVHILKSLIPSTRLDPLCNLTLFEHNLEQRFTSSVIFQSLFYLSSFVGPKFTFTI